MLRHELIYPLRRFVYAVRMAPVAGEHALRIGWQVHRMIHAEALRTQRETHVSCRCSRAPAADEALYDDVLEEAGAHLLRQAFGGGGDDVSQ